MPLRTPESAADKSSATPAPTSGARNSHATGSGERSRVTTQRKHVKSLRLPVPVAMAPAGARMAPANALPARRLVHGAAELRRRDKRLRNKQRMAVRSLPVAAAPSATTQTRQGSETTTRNNKPRVVPGNRLNCSSRRQPTGAQLRAPVCQPAAPIHRPRQVNTQTSTANCLKPRYGQQHGSSDIRPRKAHNHIPELKTLRSRLKKIRCPHDNGYYAASQKVSENANHPEQAKPTLPTNLAWDRRGPMRLTVGSKPSSFHALRIIWISERHTASVSRRGCARWRSAVLDRIPDDF